MKLSFGQTTRKLAAVLSMAAVVCVFAFGGCDSKEKKPAANSPAVIMISGDTGPWIVPCGCAANQAGGLMRRATVLHQHGGPNLLYADVGGAAAGNGEYFRTKFEATIAGEKLMGIAVHNIGRPEMELGIEALSRTMETSGVTFISANVSHREHKQLAPSHKIVDLAGRRVMMVGVASPKHRKDGFTITDPQTAITTTAAAAKGQFDSLVVLAYMPEDELLALAAALPEADAVIGGPTGQAMTPRKVGPTLVASATNKGKFLVKLTAEAKGWKGELVEVSHTYADDPKQLANLKQYLATLEKLDIAATDTGLIQPIVGPPAGYAIAGSQSCAACHKEDQSVWQHSKHGHAGQTLADKGFHVDAYCLQCHTTGFGLPGGFVSPKRTPALAVVGCESCHGPSAAHVKDPKTRTPFAAFDQCIRCHDQENSPTFNRDTFWAKIKHGKKQEGTQ